MADIDLTRLSSDEFVLHFGGRPREVNAFTFSNSLLAISEALREINKQINPEHGIEISIEALGEGSFRAKIKAGTKSLTGLFTKGSRDLLIGILAAIIYDKYISDGQPKIIVQDESYIVEYGHDRIILPKQVMDAKTALSRPEDIEKYVARTFDVLEDDPSVTEFGIAAAIADPAPLAPIPRSEFPRLAVIAEPIEVDDDRKRHLDENARLVVIKAILERGDRRWQFVWNGIRISAPIKDPSFFDRVASREYQFAQGDILIATLRIHQVRDEMSGAFINERYEVIKVLDRESGPTQTTLFR